MITGRPSLSTKKPSGDSPTIQIRLTRRQDTQLATIAAKQHTTVSAIIRHALTQKLDQTPAEPPTYVHKTKRRLVRLPTDLHHQLLQQAHLNNTTPPAIARQAITSYLEQTQVNQGNH